MRKIFPLILVFTIIASGSIFSQKLVSKGFIGGLNISNVYGEDIKNNTFRTGFSFGAFAAIGLSNKFLIQPEVHYTSKGFTSEEKESHLTESGNYSVNHEGTLSLNYIEIPLLAVFTINKNFQVFGGPYMDIFLNGEARQVTDGFFTYDNGTEVTKTAIYEDETVKINSNDIRSPGYGLTIGADFLLTQVSFGARYSLGLSQIPDAGKVSFNHSNIQFMFGYFFK